MQAVVVHRTRTYLHLCYSHFIMSIWYTLSLHQNSWILWKELVIQFHDWIKWPIGNRLVRHLYAPTLADMTLPPQLLPEMKLTYSCNNLSIIARVEQMKIGMMLRYQALPFCYNNLNTLQRLSRQPTEFYPLLNCHQTDASSYCFIFLWKMMPSLLCTYKLHPVIPVPSWFPDDLMPVTIWYLAWVWGQNLGEL